MTGVGGMTIASMEPNTTTLPVHMLFMLPTSRDSNSGNHSYVTLFITTKLKRKNLN